MAKVTKIAPNWWFLAEMFRLKKTSNDQIFFIGVNYCWVCSWDFILHLRVEIFKKEQNTVSKFTFSYHWSTVIGNLETLKNRSTSRFFQKWFIVPWNIILGQRYGEKNPMSILQKRQEVKAEMVGICIVKSIKRSDALHKCLVLVTLKKMTADNFALLHTYSR